MDSVIHPLNKLDLNKCISAVLQASFQSSPLVIPSPGRSGAKFFISKNRKFYVKTIEGEDIERLHNILPQYHHVSCSVLLQTSTLCTVQLRGKADVAEL